MSKQPFFPILACALALAFPICLAAQDTQKLDRLYQEAVADYEAGKFTSAAERLERVLPYASQSYPVHELIGLTYASLNQNDKAIEHLKQAVQLNPQAAEGRTNLGAALLHSGKADLAGEQFRKAVSLDPHSFNTNHNLGEFYLQSGKLADGVPLLEAAHAIQPDAYENTYDLALAYFTLGRTADSRTLVSSLIAQRDAGELRNLLGQIDEKDGKYVAAVNDFEAASHLDPSEDNLFDWGSELLLHRTYEPAIAVFKEAARRYPKSPRILIGLGLSLYSRGIYDEAVGALIAAADLNPSDYRPYRFLSKAYDSSPKQADNVIEAFKRYAELKPTDALAQYYYAMSLWKGKRAENADIDAQKIEALLTRAVQLDDNLADAHVQLGNLYADQHAYEKSIPHYLRAIGLNPDLSDAHYRLGTDYVHTGKKEDAQREFAIYQKLRTEHLAEVEKERAEVQQFVYSEKSTNQVAQ